MDLKDFVSALSFSTFNELRKVVVEQHQSNAEAFCRVYKHLEATPELLNDPDHMKVIYTLVQQFECHPEMCAQALGACLKARAEGKSQMNAMFGV